MPFSPRYDFITPFADESMRLRRETWANPTMLSEELWAIFQQKIPQPKQQPIIIQLTNNGGQQDFIRFRNNFGDIVGALDQNLRLVKRKTVQPRESLEIQWEDPADIVPGTPLSGTQLNAVAVDQISSHPVDGAYEYIPPSGTVLPNGRNQPLKVVFTPTNSTSYKKTRKTVHINVGTPTFVIQVTGPTSFDDQSSLSAQGLSLTDFKGFDGPDPMTDNEIAGTIGVSPSLSTTPSAPSITLHVTFTPDNVTDYSSSADNFVYSVSTDEPDDTHVVQTGGPTTFNDDDSLEDQGLAISNYAGLDPDDNPVAGTIEITDPALSTTPSEPSVTVSVSFTPDDTDAYNPSDEEFDYTVTGELQPSNISGSRVYSAGAGPEFESTLELDIVSNGTITTTAKRDPGTVAVPNTNPAWGDVSDDSDVQFSATPFPCGVRLVGGTQWYFYIPPF